MKPQMRTKPFSISPHPDLLYLTSSLEQTLFKIKHVVSTRAGLTSIMGDVGLGKSAVLRYLFTEYIDDAKYVPILVPSPSFPSDFAMLKSICADVGLPRRRSFIEQENELRGFLIEQDRAEKTVVLMIDEAQRLKGPHLELIRTLLNFETNEYKLLQIVLAGQLELRTKLLDASKKALRSRMYLPSLLSPLSLSETKEMIQFRCEKAGIINPFTDEGVARIYERSNGTPREILKLCDFSYVLALQAGEKSVPLPAIELACQEVSLEDEPNELE